MIALTERDHATCGAVATIAKNAPSNVLPRVIAEGQLNPYAVAADADNVYWVNRGHENMDPKYVDGAVLTCPKAGCPLSGPVVLARDVHDPRGIALDATAIYWTVYGTAGTEGAVMRLAK